MPTSPTSHYAAELQASCATNLSSPLPTFDSVSPYSTTNAEPSIRYIQPPNPEWGWGDGVETTELGRQWMEGVNGKGGMKNGNGSAGKNGANGVSEDGGIRVVACVNGSKTQKLDAHIATVAPAQSG